MLWLKPFIDNAVPMAQLVLGISLLHWAVGDLNQLSLLCRHQAGICLCATS